jgi:uncharacterized membrane protein
MSEVRDLMELASVGVEVLAVVIMLCFIILGTAGWMIRSMKNMGEAYKRYRVVLGKTMLVGLELLVAADIIRTVAVELTLINIEMLAALVVVRTFLGWSIVVELEGRWPWQKETVSGPGTEREKINDTAHEGHKR